jgi:hypothetical protein
LLTAHGLNLYEPGEASAGGDLHRIATWATEFLNTPHRDLGRRGPVCPYTRQSLENRTFLLGQVRGPEIAPAVELYREWFVELLEQTAEERRHLLTILVVLPDLDRSDAGPLDEVQARLKDAFVRDGLMVGQFHPRCEQSGLWNEDFRPLRAPVPLMAIRRMVSSDLPFLLGSAGHLSAYLSRFAPGIPGHVRRLLVSKVAA